MNKEVYYYGVIFSRKLQQSRFIVYAMCKDLIILCCLQLDAENTQKEVTFSIRLDIYRYAFYMFDFNYNLPVM